MTAGNFSELIAQGDQMIAMLGNLSDNYDADAVTSANMGKASDRLHEDEYFGWFTACERRVQEVFGQASPRYIDWKTLAAGGMPSVGSHETGGNVYLPYLTHVRNCTSRLRALENESRAVTARTSLERFVRSMHDSWDYLRGHFGFAGGLLVTLAVLCVLAFWYGPAIAERLSLLEK